MSAYVTYTDEILWSVRGMKVKRQKFWLYYGKFNEVSKVKDNKRHVKAQEATESVCTQQEFRKRQYLITYLACRSA